MDWEKVLPFAVVGGIVIAAMAAMRPPAPTVVNPNPPTSGGADDTARLQAAVALAQLATEREKAQMQIRSELAGLRYELAARQLELAAQQQSAWLDAQASVINTAVQSAVAQNIAKIQADAEAKKAEYEAKLKQQEAELEKKRIEAEKEAAAKQAEAQFWGSFWSGLFGLGAAIIAAFSDEALYQRAIPPYIPPSGQLSLLARRQYGHRARTGT